MIRFGQFRLATLCLQNMSKMRGKSFRRGVPPLMLVKERANIFGKVLVIGLPGGV